MRVIDATQQVPNVHILATQTRAESPSCSSRLLLVEDSADGAALLRKVLESVGYSVQLANNAAEAIRLAEAEPFDLVISDIGLPGMDGFELMAELRDRFSLCGIALTGFELNEHAQRVREVGFREYLVKPVEIAQLDQAIRRVLGPHATPLPK